MEVRFKAAKCLGSFRLRVAPRPADWADGWNDGTKRFYILRFDSLPPARDPRCYIDSDFASRVSPAPLLQLHCKIWPPHHGLTGLEATPKSYMHAYP